MKKITKSKVGIAALLVTLTVVAISAVGAYAYFTKGASGSGAATVGNTTGLTVNQAAIPAGALYPGGDAVALSGSFTNPNPGPVLVGQVHATIASVTPSTTVPTNSALPCTPADFVISGTATGPFSAPGGSTGGSWSGLYLQMKNTDTNQNACKLATVNITYTADQAA